MKFHTIILLGATLVGTQAFAMGKAPVAPVQEDRETLERVSIPQALNLTGTDGKAVVLDQATVAAKGLTATFRQNLLGGDDLLLKSGDISVSVLLGSSLPFRGHNVPQNLDGLKVDASKTKQNLAVDIRRVSAGERDCRPYTEILSCQMDHQVTHCSKDQNGKDVCTTDHYYTPGQQRHDYTDCSELDAYSVTLLNASGALALGGTFSTLDSWKENDYTSSCVPVGAPL